MEDDDDEHASRLGVEYRARAARATSRNVARDVHVIFRVYAAENRSLM